MIGLKKQCDMLILKPQLLLSHMFANHDPNMGWSDADKLCEKFLNRYGFAGMKVKEE